MDLYVVGGMPLDVVQSKAQQMNEQKEKLEQEIDSIEKEETEAMTRHEALEVASSFAEVLESGDF